MIRPISKKLLKQIRQLRQKKFRRAYGQFVISGFRAVSLALENRNFEFLYLLVEKHQTALLNRFPTFGNLPVYTLTRSEFAYISDEQTPQGVALVARLPQISLQQNVLSARMIFLQNISDPGNFGTILRTAAWFGWQTVLLGSHALDPYQPKAVRASAGAITQVKILQNVSAETLEQMQVKEGYSLVGTTVRKGQALPEFKPEAKGKYILIFGSEAHGLSSRMIEMCDIKLSIPKFGHGESLNLAIAVSLVLYQFTALPPQRNIH